MDWEQTVSDVKELFYQCRFKKVVELVDSLCQRDDISIDHHFTLQMRKSAALFEMHRVAESKSVLRDLTQFQQKQSDVYVFATARLAYMDQEYEMSERLFKILADRSETVKDYFQAVIGLANVYFSLNKAQDVDRLINDMQELEDLVNLDQKLSLFLIRANAGHLFHQDATSAKKLLQKCMREAVGQGWNYFIIKAIYTQACIYKDLGKFDALEVSLDLLRCYLDPEECLYLTYIVNERFKDLDYSLSCSMQMDPDLRRICVQEKWIPLHDKPLIYDFLELLYSKGTFVGKNEIASRLWPEEEYKPRTHDPRIFDLARRIRALIEPYENQPVCLLSGRQGYKLAGKDQSQVQAQANVVTKIEQDMERRPYYEHRESV